MSTTLQIYSLGGLVIKENGQLIPSLASHKAEALLLYLLRAERPQPREILANFLEDDRSHTQSMNNLRVVLHRLRHRLDAYVLVTRQMIGLHPENKPWFDVAALEAGIRTARDLWKREQRLSSRDVKQLESALALYQGDFLSGFSGLIGMQFEEWLMQQRELIRLQVVDGLNMLLTTSLESRRFSAGIAHASHLLQLDPFQDAIHHKLMFLLAQTGQTSAALAQFETYRRLFEEELGVALNPDILKLREEISSGTLQIQQSARKVIANNLPSQPTPFIGRTVELSQITERLSDSLCRLMTLVGIGGTGKTRLALEAGAQMMDEFPDGVYVIFLEALDLGHLLSASLASVLKVKPDEAGNFDAPLFAYLQDKSLLLIFDAFEHLVENAPWISRLLAAAPYIKLLVTSRERLALSEEWLLPIEGFDSPPVDQAAAENNGVQLFTHIARRLNANFSLNHNLAHIGVICRLVEGMPLAIELAAGWTWSMECSEIRQSLEDNLDVLNANVRNIPARQRNMQALFQRSWDFLAPEQQQIMASLSVFRGGFTLESALAVARADDVSLEGLADKSLLRCVEGRYHMHDLLRRFSLGKLQEQAQFEPVYAQYVDYFRRWTHTLYTSDDVGDAFSPEINNLRAALARSLNAGDAVSLIEIGGSMLPHWMNHGTVSEGIEWIKQGVSLAGEAIAPVQHAKASTVLGILYWSQSDFASAETHLEEGSNRYRSLSMYQGLSQALNYRGYVALNVGNYERAKACFEEILAVARQQNSGDALVAALSNLGMIAGELNDIETAQVYLEEALETARALHLQDIMAVILNNLGVMADQQDNLEQARIYYEEANALAHAQDLKPQQAMGAVNLGELAQKMGDYQTAITYFQNALDILFSLGDKLSCIATIEHIAFWAIEMREIKNAAILLGALQVLRESLQAPLVPRQQEIYERWVEKLHDDPTYHETDWGQGRELTFEEVVSKALQIGSTGANKR